MSSAMSVILSLSVSGSVMALLLLAVKPAVGGRISKRFYYYVWLLVLLRLCLPVSGSVNLLGTISVRPETGVAAPHFPAGHALPQNAGGMEVHTSEGAANPNGGVEAASPGQDGKEGRLSSGDPLPQDISGQSFWSAAADLAKDPAVWLRLWAAGAVLTCAWYVSGYLRFSTRIRKNSVPMGSEAMEILSELCAGRRPELVSCASVDTPMLLGIINPVIALPERGYERGILRNILRHEMCHYHRGDLYYKWFAMFVLCAHWFNPLMYVIRRELNHACELACDEAVIHSMSAAERHSYGETLLSLAVGKRRTVGILATTMSEEKAQLKGRLIGIMNYKKTSAAAIALSLAIALLLCGCGAILGATPSPSDEKTALTEEEIAWFNTEFFNGDDFNIHNQFIGSLYEKPMDVDVYGLFYLGTGETEPVGDEEFQAVLAAAGLDQDPECGCEKVSVSAMDKVLTENMGLTLVGTSGIGLDQMIYVEQYDAYYHFHGDTNYLGVTVDEGYRDDAGNVWLKYTCLTWYESSRVLHLKENGDGYWFMSNTEIAQPSGIVMDGIDVPDEVLEKAKTLVTLWFKGDQAYYPDYHYVNWRIESLAYSYTYDDFEGMTLVVYRMNHEFLSETPENVVLAGGMYITEEGWVMPGYPDCMYLIFRQDGENLTFLSAMMENDTSPGNELFTSDLQQRINYAPDDLTADTSVGIEFYLDYADDDIVVFHGYFGLFVYDLNEQKITSAVDFKKTLGCNWVNGSVVASVAVSDDGRTVRMYLSGSNSDAEEMGLDIDSAWYLDTATNVLTKDAYRDLEHPFGDGDFVANQSGSGLTSTRAVPFLDGNAFLWCAEDRLGDMTYVRADMLWKLFDGYFD